MKKKETQLGLYCPQIEGVRVDMLGAMFPDPESSIVPEDDIRDLLRRAADLGRTVHFIIGDAINYALAHYEGDVYERFSELTGYEVSTLKIDAMIARRIPREARRPALTFEHHKIVAHLEADDRDKFLGLAEEHRLNRPRLRRSVLLGRLATEEDMQEEPGGGDDNLIPHVNRIVALGERLEASGFLDRATPEMIYTMHRDLLPALSVHLKLIARLEASGDLTISQEIRNDLRRLRATASNSNQEIEIE